MSQRPAATIEGLESRRLLSGVVALTETNRLFQFNTATPETLFKGTPIKGLSAGDSVVGIDFRPASGELYGLVNGTSVDRVVKINPVNGKTSTTFTLTTALSGTKFGVDFNPVADALRITSNTGQNLRVPFASGATVVDATLAYNANDLNGGATPNVVASAYSNSFAGATSTLLYNVDATLDTMTIQSPPNAGTQISRGPLGIDTTDRVGFDVEPSRTLGAVTNDAFVTLTRAADTAARLYRINLATGATTDVGIVGGTSDPRNVRAIAIVPTGGTTTSALRREAASVASTAAWMATPAGASTSRASTLDRDESLIA